MFFWTCKKVLNCSGNLHDNCIYNMSYNLQVQQVRAHQKKVQQVMKNWKMVLCK